MPAGQAAITPLTYRVSQRTKRYTRVNESEFFVKNSRGAANDVITAIIHASGPDTRKKVDAENKKALLRSAYTQSLTLASGYVDSIAFPLISAGIFGYNVADSAQEVLPAVITTLKNMRGVSLTDVYLMFLLDDVGKRGLPIYMTELRKLAATDDTIHIIYDADAKDADLVRPLAQLSQDMQALARRI